MPIYFFPSSRHFPQFYNGDLAAPETEPKPRNISRIWPFGLAVKDTALPLPSHITGTGHALKESVRGKDSKYLQISDKASRTCMGIFFLLPVSTMISQLYLNIFKIFLINLEALSKHCTVIYF